MPMASASEGSPSNFSRLLLRIDAPFSRGRRGARAAAGSWGARRVSSWRYPAPSARQTPFPGNGRRLYRPSMASRRVPLPTMASARTHLSTAGIAAVEADVAAFLMGQRRGAAVGALAHLRGARARSLARLARPDGELHPLGAIAEDRQVG